MAQALLEGNFNADPEEDCTTPVKPEAARGVFMQDAKANGQKWITADLADYGSDNVIILVWDGFHVVDMKIITHSKPRENANALMAIAQEYGIADTHIIFDATNARYILDYIPDAVPYLSARKSFGLYAHQAPTVKDMCYLRHTYLTERSLKTDSRRRKRKIQTTEMGLSTFTTIVSGVSQFISWIIWNTIRQASRMLLWDGLAAALTSTQPLQRRRIRKNSSNL